MDQSCFIKVIGIIAAILSLSLSLFGVVTADKIMLEQANTALQQGTVVLAEYTYHVFDGADLALRLVETDIGKLLGAPMGEKIIHGLLSKRMENFAQSMALLYVDEVGIVRGHSRVSPAPPINVTDRDYFIAMTERCPHSDRLYIGQQVANRVNGSKMVPVSRCIRPEGRKEFAGTVMAALDVAYLAGLYSRLRLAPGTRVFVQRTDGRVLVRWPEEATPPPEEKVLSATEAVKGFDIVVGTSSALEEIRKPWRPILLAIVASAFMSGLCVLLVAMYASSKFRQYEYWERLKKQAGWKPTVLPGGKNGENRNTG